MKKMNGNDRDRRHAHRLAGALLVATLACGPGAQAQTTLTTDLSQIPTLESGMLAGYLAPHEQLDSARLLPPPPAENSLEWMADQKAYQRGAALRGSAAWELAARDAPYTTADVASYFSCALGITINHQATPNLNVLLRRTLTDAGRGTSVAKKHYQRPRPYVVNNAPTCEPGEEEGLRNNGSYPSGHASLGWTWGLVLSQVAPEKTSTLTRRGYDYGQERVICGYHWQSDVDAGRLAGAAVFAQLQSNPVYLAQLAAAKREYQAALANGPAPSCDLERRAAQEMERQR